jgi:hypothetical protein
MFILRFDVLSSTFQGPTPWSRHALTKPHDGKLGGIIHITQHMLTKWHCNIESIMSVRYAMP